LFVIVIGKVGVWCTELQSGFFLLIRRQLAVAKWWYSFVKNYMFLKRSKAG